MPFDRLGVQVSVALAARPENVVLAATDVHELVGQTWKVRLSGCVSLYVAVSAGM